MREQQYRAWDKEEKVMCEVEVISFSGGGCSLVGNAPTETQIQGDFVISRSVGQNNGHFCKFQDIILMQYIGREDINGKKIFEGDITNHGVVEYNSKLNWDGGSIHPGFYFKEGYEYNEDSDLSYHTGFDDCEVLGNIYENPEVIKEK